MPRKVYVASSWRNQHQNSVVRALRGSGHEVYDFKNPKEGNNGFAWEQIDFKWRDWTPEHYVYEVLNHRVTNAGFKLDIDGLQWCDTCILLLPCGRSAHLEAGWCIGAGKPTGIFISNEKFQPDLMYKMANMVSHRIEDIYPWVDRLP